MVYLLHRRCGLRSVFCCIGVFSYSRHCFCIGIVFILHLFLLLFAIITFSFILVTGERFHSQIPPGSSLQLFIRRSWLFRRRCGLCL